MKSILSGLLDYWPCHELAAADGMVSALGKYTIPSANTPPPSAAAARPYRARSMSGTQNFTLADDPFFDPGDTDFCFCGWIGNVNTLGTDKAIFSKSGGAGQFGYALYFDAGDVMRWVVSGNGAAFTTLGITGVINQNIWIFFMVYHDSVNNLIGGRSFNPNIGGSFLDPVSTAHATGVFPNTANFAVGVTPGHGNADFLFCEFGYWNRILNDREVTYLYNYGRGRTYPFWDRRFVGSYRGHGNTITKHRNRVLGVSG